MYKYTQRNENKRRIVERMAEVREESGTLSYFDISLVLGCHVNTLQKRMQMPTDEQTAEIMAAIDEIQRKHKE